MADIFSATERSEIMSRVKNHGNKATELRLIEIFRTHHVKGWRRRRGVFGNPDFIFPARRLAIFVDGCFWHCCPLHGTIPRTNRAFWKNKLSKNHARDKLVGRELGELGWQVLRIWQHELSNSDKVARRVKRVLDRGDGYERPN